MAYKPNPKTAGSGVVCCIPQTGKCPNECEDCFFQSGRSYLEPLGANLPNMPEKSEVDFRVVRVNDGNDSNVERGLVEHETVQYPLRFYNTAIPRDLETFTAPVVLTVNPGGMTDTGAHLVDPCPPQLMMVRFRANVWNVELCDEVVEHYTEREIPIILTFMAYFALVVPEEDKGDYVFRKRTTNSYWAITTEAWERVMARYKYNRWVHSCGKIEGEKGSTACRHCGNCLREFFACRERMSS